MAFEMDFAFEAATDIGQAHDGVGQLALAIAAYTGEAVDFARMQFEVDAVEHAAALRRCRRAQAAHRQAHRPAR